MSKRNAVNFIPRWPSVATIASLPNVAGSPTQDASVEVGDECFVTGTSTLYACSSATLGSASWVAVGAASTETVLWQWNNTDLTQFDTPQGDAGFSWSVTTWDTRYTGLAGIDTTPCIRCDSPNVAPQISFLPIKIAQLPSPMPTRFAMIARMGCNDGNAVPMLICYWEDSSNWFGAWRNANGQFMHSHRDAGAWTDQGLIQTVTQENTIFHPGDYCRLNAHVVPATNAAKPIVGVGTNSDKAIAINPTKAQWYATQTQASYSAGWLALAHNPRVGLAMRAWNNVAVSPGHVFADIKIVSLT